MAETRTRTTCPYCGVGCGLIATRHDDGRVTVAGDPDHPANFGRLCSKGAALGETVGLEGRLLYPEMKGRRISWDLATRVVANRFAKTIEEHGPDSVAFYVSGQLLTEDYYVANKLMKGFIGSANIDTNSRLCMSSSVAGHMRAFGSDTVPGCYEDLERADLVVLTGSNLAWCHPVLFQRLAKAREERGTRVVVIDPRRTETCSIADLHLPLKPGTDVTLFNGLLAHLDRVGAGDDRFMVRHTEGVGPALEAAQRTAPDPARVAAVCELPEQDVLRFYEGFARTERTVTVYSQGVNQSVQGADKVNAILNCHLFTGRIGREGMGPFSVTGQPNAMGGREVGGLANMLAAHTGFSDRETELVRSFWNAPNMVRKQGLKALDLFDAMAEGRVKAVWIMCTNPATSLPNGARVRKALERCDFIVVSDCMAETDTTRHADVLLPAATWGERDGTVTNSERRISRQKPFLDPPGEARPDWKIVADVAAKMGYGGFFAYDGPAQVFDEHARLSKYRNRGSRDFDIGGLAGLGDPGYDALVPVQWPIARRGWDGAQRLFANGGFFRPGGRAGFVAVEQRFPQARPGTRFPFVLNSGRLRDQWHTMTRSGKAPTLARHRPEPFVEVHPDDAEPLGLVDGGFAEVATAQGLGRFKVSVTEAVRRGELFLPIHWSATTSRDSGGSRLMTSERDPVSGQPGSKFAPARITAWTPDWTGFLISRSSVSLDLSYWACHAVPCGYLNEIGGKGDPVDAFEGILSLLKEGEQITYVDRVRGVARAASLRHGRLEACLFLSRRSMAIDRAVLLDLFDQRQLSERDRQAVLAARSPSGTEDVGRIVCACFSVGLNTLVSAIRDQGLVTADAVGVALKAGTNCGSCIPEIGELIAKSRRLPQSISDAA